MNGEFFYLQTFDGKQLYAPDQAVNFLVSGNFGAPPVNWVTRRGFHQHGATEVDYLLEPRTITVQLWRAPACSRQAYWDNRLALHEFLRHNRGGPLKFVFIEPNGTQRALTVRANPGLTFPMQETDGNNAWDVNEAVDFQALDPVWYDPDTVSTFLAGSNEVDLIFPITFPIVFGVTTSIESHIPIVYQGTWREYPTLTLIGPYSSVNIFHWTTFTFIGLISAIGAGESRIITLTPGDQTVTDQFGNNKLNELHFMSDLINFALLPDPEIAGGIQEIRATFAGGVAGHSAIQVDYHTRWFAL